MNSTSKATRRKINENTKHELTWKYCGVPVKWLWTIHNLLLNLTLFTFMVLSIDDDWLLSLLNVLSALSNGILWHLSALAQSKINKQNHSKKTIFRKFQKPKMFYCLRSANAQWNFGANRSNCDQLSEFVNAMTSHDLYNNIGRLLTTYSIYRDESSLYWFWQIFFVFLFFFYGKSRDISLVQNRLNFKWLLCFESRIDLLPLIDGTLCRSISGILLRIVIISAAVCNIFKIVFVRIMYVGVNCWCCGCALWGKS